MSVNRKSFLSLTCADKYFNQNRSNDTPIKHFLPGNIQDKMDTFDRNYIDFFVKIHTHLKLGDAQTTSIPQTNRKSKFGEKNMLKSIKEKYVKKHLRQNN